MDSNSLRTLTLFLRAMFPGDLSKGIPSIVALSGFDKSVLVFKKVDSLSKILMLLEFTEADEINLFISNAKNQYGGSEINAFINDCIDYYFGHSDVIMPLTNKHSPLFPNEVIINDIDFDLLEPVYLRKL
jgi:hypothetical protein